MANFLEIARDLTLTDAVGDKRASFERVFSAIGKLQQVHSKAQLDLANIESIFTALELGVVIQRVPGLAKEEITQAIAALKTLIVKTLELRIAFPVSGRSVVATRSYAQFADLVRHLRKDAFPQQSVSVLTFNYDIAADVALHFAGLNPDYGLQAGEVGGATPLLKLHGSMNWALAGKEVKALSLGNYLSHIDLFATDVGGTFNLDVGTNLAALFRRDGITITDPEPVIVPPSWNKADYHSAISNVWAAAAHHLSEAQYIFVIGYSLPQTDAFFRHLYALGSVGNSPLRKFVVFNLDNYNGPVDTRFREMLGPAALACYTYRSLNFPNAIYEIQSWFPPKR